MNDVVSISIIRSIPVCSEWVHAYHLEEYVAFGVALAEVVVDHVEPVPDFLYYLSVPFGIGLQLGQ